jgi:hypothetical protein
MLPLDEIKARYQRDGFVFPITVMSEGKAASYRAALEAAEAEFPDLINAKTCLRRYPNLVLPFVDEISRMPEVTGPVAALLGEDLLALDCPFFIKEAKTTSFVSWHQDLTYWGLDGEDEVSAWIALSPATRESGCMRFVAGSQNQTIDHRDTHDPDNLLTRGQEMVVEVPEDQAVDIELRPGQMSLHHGKVFHASNPNISDDRRIGLAIRFIPAQMRQVAGGQMAAMLVRGQDRYGHFRPCKPPFGLVTAADLAHWHDISGARNAVMMKDG